MTRERHMELIKMAIGMPEEERMALMDSGMFNSIIEGYLVAALEEIGMDPKVIGQAAYELYHTVFDEINAYEAAKKAMFGR